MFKGVVICAFALVLPEIFATRFDLNGDVQNSLQNHQGLYHRHQKRAPSHEDHQKHKKAPKLYIVNKHLEQEIREGFLNTPPPPSKPLRFIVTPPPPNVTTTPKPPVASQPAIPVNLNLAQNGAKIALQLVDVNNKKQPPKEMKVQVTTAAPKKPQMEKKTPEENAESEDYDLNDNSFSEDDSENSVEGDDENEGEEADNRKSDSYSESYFRIWV